MHKAFAAALLMLSLFHGHALADVPLAGLFVAHEPCPALQSIRRQTNPGSVQIEPGRSYPLLAKNKPAPSHYLIEVAGADPARRWVATACGEHVVPADGSGSRPPQDGAPGDGQGGARPSFVLAVSWQPAFCETGAGSGKPECELQTPQRFDASHFTLHGLWPQPGSNIYCHVSPEHVAASKDRKWERLPDPTLTPETRRELERVMPGTMSKLDRHEWIKHGTCFEGESAEAYFSRSIALMNQLNASRPRELFASNIGSEITSAAIREAFDEAFGDGAGERVRVSCKRDGSRNLIVEITIGLAGKINDEPSFAELIAASEPTDPGCPRGIVDPVGLQ